MKYFNCLSIYFLAPVSIQIINHFVVFDLQCYEMNSRCLSRIAAAVPWPQRTAQQKKNVLPGARWLWGKSENDSRRRSKVVFFWPRQKKTTVMRLKFFCFPSAARAASRGGEHWLGLETGCGQRRWVEATCHEASAELICICSVCVSVHGLFKSTVYGCASNAIFDFIFVPDNFFKITLSRVKL